MLAAGFVLTMVIPLQNAVLAGVGISVILYTIRQSGQITIKRRVQTEDGDLIEELPPEELPQNEVVVLQAYGSLFFAAARVFEDGLPAVTGGSHNSVVILRFRGRTDMGSTFMDVLRRYANALSRAGSKLVIAAGDDHVLRQLAVRRATEEALLWIASER